jgi:hypothetical protein
MPEQKISDLRGTTLELTRRGRKVPETLVRRLVEVRQRELAKTLKEKNSIRKLAERDLSSGKRVREPTSMEALRKASQHVSGRKLAAPAVLGEIGGLFSYTLNFTPPYDYVMSDGDLDGGGNLLTADPRAGTLDWNIEDETNDGLIHFGWVEMGSFFFPPGDHKILSVRSSPAYNWSWWLASAGPIAELRCDVEVGLAGFKGVADPWVQAGAVAVFAPDLDSPGFQFDMGSSANDLIQTHPIVEEPADLYLAFVRVTGAVDVGSPSPQTGGGGAVGGGKLLAAVPSITVQVQRTPPVFLP